MKKLIAYCGLDCEQCEARIATINDDNDLRACVAKRWSEMNGIEIKPEFINCDGCRADGVKTYYCSELCQIRKCAEEKGVETCGKCALIDECEIVGQILKNNPIARNYLKEDFMLQTQRLILRRWHDEDAPRLFALASDPEVGPAAGWEPHKSVEESLKIIHTAFNFPTVFAIVSKETGKIIGCIGFLYDEHLCKNETESLMGYWIGKEYWNKGYVTEAAKECIRYAFEELKLSRIWCGNFKENARSACVQKKCGFKFDHIETDDNWSEGVKEVIINHLDNKLS
jgi:RimJ/RimL family protein N-acetyltransferase